MLCSLVFNSNLICKYIQEYVLLQLSIWEIGTSNEGMLVQSVVDFEYQDFVYRIRIEISQHLIFLMGWTTTGDLRLIYAFLIINLRIKSVGYVIYIYTCVCLYMFVCTHFCLLIVCLFMYSFFIFGTMSGPWEGSYRCHASSP